MLEVDGCKLCVCVCGMMIAEMILGMALNVSYWNCVKTVSNLVNALRGVCVMLVKENLFTTNN